MVDKQWKYWSGAAFLAVVLLAMVIATTRNKSAPAASEVGDVSVASGPVFLIDVRTPQEFAEGHLVGAVNIEYQEIVSKIGSVTTDKNARIEVYCRSGNRSGKAQKSLKDVGYKNVKNIGGFEALRQIRAVE